MGSDFFKQTPHMSTKGVGDFGERIAGKYLKDKGYRILDKNYSFRFPGSPQKGEIDIVAKKADIISFVEVKSLKVSSKVIPGLSPEVKVNFGKQRKLVRTAESWLMAKRIALNSKWQIDVISVMIKEDKSSFFPFAASREIDGRKVKIWHFENAVSYV